MLIRGETIKYSKRRAKRFREQEVKLTNDIANLRNISIHTNAEADINNLIVAQEKLEKLREPKIHGAITRSRVRWYEEGEKCSSFFLSLEKRNGIRKSIQSITVNDEVIQRNKTY